MLGNDAFGGDDSGDESMAAHTTNRALNSTALDVPPNTGTSTAQAGGPSMGADQLLATLLPQLLNTFSGAFSGSLEKLTDFATSGGKRKLEEEDKDADGPIMIDVPGHHLKDDAHTVMDKAARLLRPWMGSQADLWKAHPRKVKPVLQDLKDRFLTRSSVNPRVIEKMHDRGAELTLKMFHHKNVSDKLFVCLVVCLFDPLNCQPDVQVNVDHRRGKLRLDADGHSAAYQQDYLEPQGKFDTLINEAL